MKLNIVLVEPEIPQNTGNIARTCAALGASLHLVEPMGFQIDDKKLKRAGLDYWHLLDIYYYKNLEQFLNQNAGNKMYFLTTKGSKTYDKAKYDGDCFILFGKETAGLPESLLKDNYDNCFRLPMIEGARSINLSNAVAVVAYEAMRQAGFDKLLTWGKLTKYDGYGD